MKRLLLALAVLLPAIGVAQTNQCIGVATEVLAHRYVKRTTINNVQSQAGTWVIGSYAGNWDTYVQQTAMYEGFQSHYGTQSIQNGPSTVTFNDTPSVNGTGTYSNSNGHLAACDQWPYTMSIGTTWDIQEVDAPEIENLPPGDGEGVPSLWYFEDAPSAVPAHVGFSGGYLYQYANLTYNKNCLGNDTCNGDPTWSEQDGEGSITIDSNGKVSSTGPSDECEVYDASVEATLSGWKVDSLIWVNAPAGAQLPSDMSVSTDKWEIDSSGETTAGYMTRHPWELVGICGLAIPSMAINETFGSWSEPGATSGWTGDPVETDKDRFPGKFCPSCRTYGGEYYFEDVIGAPAAEGTPSPIYTGSGPNYTYSTVIKTTSDQKWYVGDQTPHGDGTEILDLSVKYYQDHGTSIENP